MSIWCTLDSMKKQPTKIREISRPEITGELRRAALLMAQERSTLVVSVTLTRLVNDLLFDEWQRTHPNMMFPNESGEVLPL
jgi:hypothetical protein